MSTRPGAGGPKLPRLNMGQVFIGLAIVSAILTMVIFKNMMGAKPVEQKVEAKTKPVVVAQLQMYAGEVVKPENIKVVEWPQDTYPEGEVYQSTDKLVGHAIKTDIFPGQPVFRQNMAGEGSAGGLPVIIPKGYRALTIMVTENKGVGGFIKPGDRVDIIGNFQFQLPEETQRAISHRSGALIEKSFSVTQTVLQDVQVLAIAQEMVTKGSIKPVATNPGPPVMNADDATRAKVVSSVTVAVTPEQAEKLSFADARGDLRLSLRPEDEHEQLHLIGAVGNDVVPMNNLIEKAASIESDLNIPPEDSSPPTLAQNNNMPPPPPMSPSHQVEVYEGTTRNTVSF